MAKKASRITLYRKIWCKIRYWQQLREISDSELSSYMQVGVRTLHEYDKNAQHITLGKVDNFLRASGLELNDLLSQ